MKFTKITALAAVAALALPLSVQAATILNVGDSITIPFNLAPGATSSDSFDVSQNMRINIISIAGTGTAGAADLEKILFGVNGANQGFASFIDNGSSASAAGEIASFVTSSPFTIDFSAFGTANDVGVTYSFNTSSVSTVPVPAAGGLLAGAIFAGGAFARRRKARKAA